MTSDVSDQSDHGGATMTTATTTVTTFDDVMALRPCPECPNDDVRQVGPLDERCPRCTALREWSFFVPFQHYRNRDLVRANPDGCHPAIDAAYEAGHVDIFEVECSEVCGASDHRIAAAKVARYRIPSETYAALRLAEYRERREGRTDGLVAVLSATDDDDIPF